MNKYDTKRRCHHCEKYFEERHGVFDLDQGKFVCDTCISEIGLKVCSRCGKIEYFLEDDGLCEFCSPDLYYEEDEPKKPLFWNWD